MKFAGILAALLIRGRARDAGHVVTGDWGA